MTAPEQNAAALEAVAGQLADLEAPSSPLATWSHWAPVAGRVTHCRQREDIFG
jgi:hypothetical protein